VRFEQSHLRQVLYNLIDNALRYASGKNACVVIELEAEAQDRRPALWVFNDGPGLSEDARSTLFEPFYTTHARGTGLGLYLAREFCEANRADIGFASRRNLDGTSREGFVIRFGRTGSSTPAEQGFLDTIPTR
jgi:two-component system sensor histidine kinase PilS (NtrC family)